MRGENPLDVFDDAQPRDETASLVQVSGKQLDEVREAWLSACLDFDEYKAQHYLVTGICPLSSRKQFVLKCCARD